MIHFILSGCIYILYIVSANMDRLEILNVLTL